MQGNLAIKNFGLQSSSSFKQSITLNQEKINIYQPFTCISMILPCNLLTNPNLNPTKPGRN